MCLGLAILAMAIPAQVFAQSKYEVKGVVVDTTGTPVIGASVVEQGTTNGVTTDLNGQYVYFFEELKNILHGDGSLLYSFSRPMGGEFMGIFDRMNDAEFVLNLPAEDEQKFQDIWTTFKLGL